MKVTPQNFYTDFKYQRKSIYIDKRFSYYTSHRHPISYFRNINISANVFYENGVIYSEYKGKFEYSRQGEKR